MTAFLRLLLLLAPIAGPTQIATANVIYEYTGTDFNSFNCVTTGSLTCFPNPYTTTDRVNGTITVSGPLAPNATYVANDGPIGASFATVLCEGGPCPSSPPFPPELPFSYTFSDGVQTLVDGVNSSTGFISLTTDASGKIVQWNVRVGTNTATGLPGTFNGSLASIGTAFIPAQGIGADAGQIGTVNALGSVVVSGTISCTGSCGINPTEGTWTPPIYLPISGGSGTPYIFDVTGILSGQHFLIDPAAATGYIFQTGAGDPNFASVDLPDIGNSGPYDLSLCSGSSFVFDTTVGPGVAFNFPTGGVSCFEITGIDPSLNLDPNNPLAFVTDLTLVGDGEFTGSMTPIVTANVPEPPIGVLFLGGIGLIALLVRALGPDSRSERDLFGTPRRHHKIGLRASA